VISPNRSLISAFGIEAQHPDEFMLNLLNLAPGIVASAAQQHRLSLKNPAQTVQEYLGALESPGLTQTASVLTEVMF